MTTFKDGPAEGKTLMIRRAPVFLRIVVDPAGEVDALDQLDDEPRDGETLFAYKIVGEPSWIHLNTGRRSGGGFYTTAQYEFIQNQPLDKEMRTTESWQAWCEAHK